MVIKKNQKMSNFCVIIPTLNRTDELILTLKSVCSSSLKPRRIIIVDDGDFEITQKNIKEIISQNLNINFVLVRAKSTGLTNARNIGLSYIKDSEIVCFLDDDVTLNSDYFEKIVSTFNSDINIIGCQGFISNSISKNIFSRVFIGLIGCIFPIKRSFFVPDVTKSMLHRYPLFIPIHNKTIYCDWLSGCNMAYRAHIFDKFKFDENFIKYSLGEDFDFSYSLRTKGYRLAINFDARLIHRFSPKFSKPKMPFILMKFGYMFYLIYKYKFHSKEAYFLCRYHSMNILFFCFISCLFTTRLTLPIDLFTSFKSYLSAYSFVKTCEHEIANGNLSILNLKIRSFS